MSKAASAINGLSVTELVDGIKIYNLTSGKSLPNFLSDRQKRKLRKTDEYRGRVELIQDFEFPTASSCIQTVESGRYIVSAGVYPPMIKIFETDNLSMKCERFVDAEVIRLQVLEDSYRKIALLRQDRTIELHAAYGKFILHTYTHTHTIASLQIYTNIRIFIIILYTKLGKHYTIRIPKFGRDMIYEKHTCDLIISASSKDVYRLNLEQGRFLQSYTTNNMENQGINRVAQSPLGCLLGFASESGTVELWDTRNKKCTAAMNLSNEELTAFEFSPDGLNMLTGTNDGIVYLHDLRMIKPLMKKEHPYEVGIHTVHFHSNNNIITADPKMIKIWNSKASNNNSNAGTENSTTSINGKSIVANIETASICETTDLCMANKNSGLFFLTGEQSKVTTFYVPTIGPAPSWCSFLDNLTEELEEDQINKRVSTWEDYKFVTKEELIDLNLSHLIGTNLLRGYMHGYFMDSRLHQRVKAVAQPEKYEEWKKEQIKKRIQKKRGQRINMRSTLPKVNKELALRQHLLNETNKNKAKDDDNNNNKIIPSTSDGGGGDSRFQDLFSNPDFQIDEASEEFKLSNPSGITAKEIELRKQHGLLPSTETERNQWTNYSDDSDGVGDEDDDNNDEDVFSDKRYVNRGLKRDRDEDDDESNNDNAFNNVVDEEEDETQKKNKKKNKLKAVPIHENVELVPGQSVKQKKLKEKRRKLQRSTLSDRLKLEDEMIEKANELRNNAAAEANSEGVYSITYKPEKKRRR